MMIKPLILAALLSGYACAKPAKLPDTVTPVEGKTVQVLLLQLQSIKEAQAELGRQREPLVQEYLALFKKYDLDPQLDAVLPNGTIKRGPRPEAPKPAATPAKK